MWKLNSDQKPYLNRYSKPTTYDHAPCGTRCHVKGIGIYVQINTNPEEPIWEYIGKDTNENCLTSRI